MKPGDLVRDSKVYSMPSFDYEECHDYEDYEDPGPVKKAYSKLSHEKAAKDSRTAVFIKWHIVDGIEDGEFYSCAKVLWARGGIGNILRQNLVLVSGNQ